MYFSIIVAIIFLLSLFLAFRSLRELTKSEEVGSVKHELKKGKIVFQDSSPVKEERNV